MSCSMPQSVCFVTEIQNWFPERIYLLEIQTVVVFCLWLSWTGLRWKMHSVRLEQNGSVTLPWYCNYKKNIQYMCLWYNVEHYKNEFQSISHRLQWRAYERSECGQSVNVKILCFSSTTTRCKQWVLTWFYVKEITYWPFLCEIISNFSKSLLWQCKMTAINYALNSFTTQIILRESNVLL